MCHPGNCRPGSKLRLRSSRKAHDLPSSTRLRGWWAGRGAGGIELGIAGGMSRRFARLRSRTGPGPFLLTRSPATGRPLDSRPTPPGAGQRPGRRREASARTCLGHRLRRSLPRRPGHPVDHPVRSLVRNSRVTGPCIARRRKVDRHLLVGHSSTSYVAPVPRSHLREPPPYLSLGDRAF